MRLKSICLLLINLTVMLNLAEAEVYKWKDENGKIHFSDVVPNKGEAETLNETELAKRINSFTNVSVNIEPIDFGVNRQVNMLVMYSTARCGYCARARSYFAEKDIDFQEKNIELSQKHRDEFNRLGGKGVPLIILGRVRMNGFSKARFEATFTQ